MQFLTKEGTNRYQKNIPILNYSKIIINKNSKNVTTMRMLETTMSDWHWPGIPLVVEVLAAAPVFPPEGGDSVVLLLASVDAASEGVLAQVVPGDDGRASTPHLPGRLSARLAAPATVRPPLSIVLAIRRLLESIYRLFYTTIYRLLTIDCDLLTSNILLKCYLYNWNAVLTY